MKRESQASLVMDESGAMLDPRQPLPQGVLMLRARAVDTIRISAGRSLYPPEGQCLCGVPTAGSWDDGHTEPGPTTRITPVT